jgi:membrane protein required for colicin V production
MNHLDIFFLIFIAASILYSFIRGLVREIFSFLAILLGFLGASYGYNVLAEWIQAWVDNSTVARILGFALLFLLIALALSLGGKLLSHLVKKMDLGWADRCGGAAFGLLKAILLIAVLLLVLTAFLPPQSRTLAESKVAPNIMVIAQGLSLLVPDRLYTLFAEKEKEMKKYWATQELALRKVEEKGGTRR